MKRFNSFKELSDLTKDNPIEFKVNQEEYDWYKDQIGGAVYSHESQGGIIKDIYFRGIKLILNDEKLSTRE